MFVSEQELHVTSNFDLSAVNPSLRREMEILSIYQVRMVSTKYYQILLMLPSCSGDLTHYSSGWAVHSWAYSHTVVCHQNTIEMLGSGFWGLLTTPFIVYRLWFACVYRDGGSGYVRLRGEVSSRAVLQGGRACHPSQQGLLWLVERWSGRG